MNEISVAFAKLNALQKNFVSITKGLPQSGAIHSASVSPLVQSFKQLKKFFVEKMPLLYGDMPKTNIPAERDFSNVYYRFELDPIIQAIDYILTLGSTHKIETKTEKQERHKRVFISHGRAQDWRKTQAFIEKQLGYGTIELEQEVSMGRTIIQKLNDASDKCSCAVIVMTGDDIAQDQVRARENVMHEIGFFQGKYGLNRIVLLHEEGVNIPTNLAGIVYTPFPKGTIEATEGKLMSELQTIFG